MQSEAFIKLIRQPRECSDLCLIYLYPFLLLLDNHLRFYFNYGFPRDGTVFWCQCSSKYIHGLSCDLTAHAPLFHLILFKLDWHLLFHCLTGKTTVVQLECVSYYIVHLGALGLVLHDVMKICRNLRHRNQGVN